MARVGDSVPGPLGKGPGAAVVASGITLLASLLAGPLPFVGIPIGAASLGWLTYRRGPVSAIAVALIAGAVLFPVDWLTSLSVAAWFLIAGPLTAWLLRRWRMMSVTLVVAALISCVFIGVLWTSAALQGETLQGSISRTVDEASELIVKSSVESGRSEETVRESIELARGTLVRYWPSGVGIVSGFITIVSVAMVAIVALRSGEHIAAPLSLDRLDLSPHVVWGLIVALALMAVSRFARGGMEVPGVIGENLLLMIRWVFFMQGLAVMAGLYRRAGFRPGARALGFVLAGVTEALAPVVSLTGLADLWINIRKLPRGDGARGQDGSLEPPRQSD